MEADLVRKSRAFLVLVKCKQKAQLAKKNNFFEKLGFLSLNIQHTVTASTIKQIQIILFLIHISEEAQLIIYIANPLD